MISRRDFLKIIGIVPVVLTLPMPQILLKEPVVSPPTPDFTLPIWGHPPIMLVDEIEYLFMTGTAYFPDGLPIIGDASWEDE